MKRQSGISLLAVAVIMGVLGAAAAFALISMRQERNLFAEGWHKAGAKAAAAPAAPLRKCVINGKTVFSNTECQGQGQEVKVQETRGIESPRVPKAEPAQAPGVQDKAIERATQ